jgi:luciferase family oxidoreductase group 1
MLSIGPSMSAPPAISVLDQSPVAQGSTGAQALRNTIDLAVLADGLGYHRYWVAEHHGGPMLAGPSPEVLIGPIACATSAIRVGSGGVMLPHYSPLKVAESFSLLSGLFPGRIDLAIGRAPGTDGLTSFALQRDRRQVAPDDFPQQLAELLGYLEDRMPSDHPFARLAGSLPGRPHAPEPWLLGSSPQSALWAAELGLPYAFADFINPDGAAIARSYFERFTDSGRLESPRLAVAVWALCADSREEAEHLAASHRWAFVKLRRGELIAVPPPEEALRELQAGGYAAAAGQRRRAVLGTGEEVRAELEKVAAHYGASEVIVVTITYEHALRRRSYELLAEAFDLEPRTAPATVARTA